MGALAELLKIVVRVKAVHAQFNGLLDHGLQQSQPMGIAHTPAIRPVRPALYGPAAQFSADCALQGRSHLIAGGRSQQILGPDPRPIAKQSLARLVIAIDPAHAQLPHHLGSSLLDARDEIAG